LGKVSFHLLPKFRRSLSRALFKYAGEVGLLVVAQVKTYFGNVFITVRQLIFGINEFSSFYKLCHRLVKDIFADKIQISSRHKQLFSIKINSQRSTVIFL